VGIVEDGLLKRAWGTQRDITDLKRLEDQLRQAQKMEAVGRLAGGVAHDFNNLLTAILGSVELLLRDLEPASPLRQDAGEIKKAGERAAELTRQLLAYSRRQVLNPEVLDLNRVVADMDRMLRRLIGEDVDLVTRPAPQLDAVRADRGQIEQVLVNLVLNARDARPQGGKLTLEPGHGTTFKIYLPRAAAPGASPASPTPSPPPAAPGRTTARGSETILVVEDEEAVRSLSRRALEASGYTVLAAADGPDAVRLLE